MAFNLAFPIRRGGKFIAGPNVDIIERPAHSLNHLSRELYGRYMQKHPKLARITAVPIGLAGVLSIPVGAVADLVYNLSAGIFSGIGYHVTLHKFPFLKKFSKQNFRFIGADVLSVGAIFVTVPADCVNLIAAPIVNPKKFGKNLEYNNSKGPPHGIGFYK